MNGQKRMVFCESGFPWFSILVLDIGLVDIGSSQGAKVVAYGRSKLVCPLGEAMLERVHMLHHWKSRSSMSCTIDLQNLIVLIQWHLYVFAVVQSTQHWKQNVLAHGCFNASFPAHFLDMRGSCYHESRGLIPLVLAGDLQTWSRAHNGDQGMAGGKKKLQEFQGSLEKGPQTFEEETQEL